MKSTAQRLGESYCKPTTEEEWKQVSGVFPLGKRFCHQKDAKAYWVEGLIGVVSDIVQHDRTEIPVAPFTDLLHDRIAPWRLEEDGFNQITPYVQTRQYFFDFVTVTFEAENVHVTIPDRLGAFGIRRCNVTTYTKLINLIEMIC